MADWPVYHTFDHTADLGLEVLAKSPEDLFASAAIAMLREMVDFPLAAPTSRLQLEVQGHDPENLMVRWLGIILAQFIDEGLLALRFEDLLLKDQGIKVQALVVDCQSLDIRPRFEIKAPTYHMIKVKLDQPDCYCRVVFDL